MPVPRVRVVVQQEDRRTAIQVDGCAVMVDRCASKNPTERPPLHTATSIHIKAPRERVFATVRELARWPEWLPHYRHIRTIGAGEKGEIVRMAASRSAIPIAWTSEFWADERQLELHFLHLEQWTKGMKVVWTLTPTRDGTRVEIVHDLRFRIPALGWMAEPIIGGFFIENIAQKTLATFKQVLEHAES